MADCDCDSDDLDPILRRLHAARERRREAHPRNQESGGRSFPAREAIERTMLQLRGALFPMRLGPVDLRIDGEDYYVGHMLSAALVALRT